MENPSDEAVSGTDDPGLTKARAALDAGNIDKSIDLCSFVLGQPNLTPDVRLQAWLLRSHVFCKRSRELRSIPAAISEGRPIYDHDPLVLAQLALKDAERALQQQPSGSPSLFACKGEALFLMENLQGAHEAYLEGLSQDPSHKQLSSLMQELMAKMPKGGRPAVSGGDPMASPQKRARRDLTALSDADEFDCTLCLKLLFEPVTTPCGHSFCRSCLFRSFDHGNKCPMCRKVLYLSGGSRQAPISVVLQNILEKHFPEEYAARRAEVAQVAISATSTDIMPLFVMDIMLPGQKMNLNIFEPRYRLMVRRCMEGDRHFGMAGTHRTTHNLLEIATECEITDCEGQPDGRFHIEVVAKRRFQIKKVWDEDGYRVAEVSWIKDEPGAAEAGGTSASSAPPAGDSASESRAPEQETAAALVASAERLTTAWLTHMREIQNSAATGNPQVLGMVAEIEHLVRHAGPKPSVDNLEAFSFWVCLLEITQFDYD
eukprot:jgi/Mesvir1/2331/Mv19356-RA.2